MNDKLKDAFKTIIEYCKLKDSCWNGCPFFDEEVEVCFFAMYDLPCDWDGDLIG